MQKELIMIEELSLTQIEHKLHSSYPSHFTSPFKKQNGIASSHFKHHKEKQRLAVYELSGK